MTGQGKILFSERRISLTGFHWNIASVSNLMTKNNLVCAKSPAPLDGSTGEWCWGGGGELATNPHGPSYTYFSNNEDNMLFGLNVVCCLNVNDWQYKRQ